MRYTSGRDFRQALEERLRTMQRQQSIPLIRLRKQVAFERFIARLATAHKTAWVLKGGLAMQLRLGNQARTTMDVDLLKIDSEGALLAALRQAAAVDLGDWFYFEVETSNTLPQDEYAGQRFHVNCLLDGRIFEAFKVDVGIGDIVLESFDTLTFDPVLEFAGFPPTQMLCYPVSQQIAEKVHALTRTYTTGTSTRIKDLVDILLLSQYTDMDGKTLQDALRLTFDRRGTHKLPDRLPELPQSLNREYRRLAGELDLSGISFIQAQQSVKSFLEPVFSNQPLGVWRHQKGKWDTR